MTHMTKIFQHAGGLLIQSFFGRYILFKILTFSRTGFVSSLCDIKDILWIVFLNQFYFESSEAANIHVHVMSISIYTNT